MYLAVDNDDAELKLSDWKFSFSELVMMVEPVFPHAKMEIDLSPPAACDSRADEREGPTDTASVGMIYLSLILVAAPLLKYPPAKII